MTKNWKWVLTLLTVTIVLCAILLVHRPVTLASGVRVETGLLCRYVGLSGTVAYAQETPVTAQSSGLLSALYVSSGERVTAGQALGRVDVQLQEVSVSTALSQWPDADTSALATALEQSVLRAPVSGVVDGIAVMEHAPVQAGMITMRIASGVPDILCPAVAADAEKLSCGQVAKITISGEERGWAQIAEITPITTDSGTTYRVRMALLDGLTLPLGGTVKAQIAVEEHRQVPLLPLSALTARETVWWYHDGYCSEIPANIVQTDENQAWVNLPAGLVVLYGEYKEGMRVQLTDIQEAQAG